MSFEMVFLVLFTLFGDLNTVLSLPFENFTHKAQLSINIDGYERGILSLGLFANESPKAVFNFLN
jgi:hypothetical protein